MFRLSKNKSSYVYCGVIEFTSQERTIIVPNWMMKFLDISEGSRVFVNSVTLPQAEFLKFKPRDERFLKLQNPKNILENNLNQYNTLFTGQVIRFDYLNNIWELEVVETKPTLGVCICNANTVFELVGNQDVPSGTMSPQRRYKGELAVVPQDKEELNNKLQEGSKFVQAVKQQKQNQDQDMNYWANLGKPYRLGKK